MLAGGTAGQFIRYIVTGLSAFVIEYLVFLLLFRLMDVSTLISNPIAVTTGFIYSFLLNKFWSFRSRSRMGIQFLMYLALFLINMLISSAVIYAGETMFSISPVLMKPITMCMIAMWNFVIYKKIIYADKKGAVNG